jgi:hypothetical protein
MTSRQIRRAAERNQMKLSNRNGFSSAPSNVSPAQLAANRANSQLSTGPTTPEGKSRSSLNAVKTGLTGRTVLLPSDDAAAYEKHILDWFEELGPVGPRECALAQSLADNAWRVLRLPALEMAIFALGRQQFAAQFEHEAPALQPGLIELHTYLTYEKQLKNLHLQEVYAASTKKTPPLYANSSNSACRKKRNVSRSPNLPNARLALSHETPTPATAQPRLASNFHSHALTVVLRPSARPSPNPS